MVLRFFVHALRGSECISHESEASPAIYQQVLTSNETSLWRCQHTLDLQVCFIE